MSVDIDLTEFASGVPVQAGAVPLREHYLARLGSLTAVPVLAQPLSSLTRQPIDPRAAFLAAHADGTMTIEDLIDVSSMSELDTLQTLVDLLDRGVLEVAH